MRSKWFLLAATAALVAGCAAPAPKIDIGNVVSVKSTFGPAFTVVTGQSGIDPKLLAPQEVPKGVTFEPADCAQYANNRELSADAKGNLAGLVATGEGNRFVAIAREMSRAVPYDAAAVDRCRHITFTGPNVRGAVDVVDAPYIDGAQTLGTHQILEVTVGGRPRIAQLYSYSAYLDDYLVRVTADPLIVPHQPVAPVNVQRAQQLLTDSVAAVRR